jgi:Domain of unknown function (DUF4124)
MRTPLATLTLGALLSLAGLASADVYKCPAPGGKTLYQDAPCAAEGEPAIISPGPGSRYVGPPVVPQAKAPDCIEIIRIDAKREPNTRFHEEIAWKVLIKNKCTTSFPSRVRFQALDDQGYEVAFDSTTLVISPGEENVATSSFSLTRAQSDRAYRTKAIVYSHP